MASQPKIPCIDNDSLGDMTPDVDPKVLEQVDNVQNQIDSLNEQASEEILKVEQKYNKLRKPHFEKRAELLAQIPNFWLNVFLNHHQLSEFLTTEDEKVIHFLKGVEVQEFEDIKSGYKINLYFDKNEYFSNEVLTKEFHVGERGESSAKASTIDWYPGKDLTTPPPKPKDNGEKKQKRVSEAMPSFFAWFSDGTTVVGDSLGECLKDEVWPNPLQYYLNPDLEDEDDDELLEDEEEEEEEEDEEGDLAYEENDEAFKESS